MAISHPSPAQPLLHRAEADSESHGAAKARTLCPRRRRSRSGAPSYPLHARLNREAPLAAGQPRRTGSWLPKPFRCQLGKRGRPCKATPNLQLYLALLGDRACGGAATLPLPLSCSRCSRPTAVWRFQPLFPQKLRLHLVYTFTVCGAPISAKSFPDLETPAPRVSSVLREKAGKRVAFPYFLQQRLRRPSSPPPPRSGA